jgi:hypothetical protein
VSIRVPPRFSSVVSVQKPENVRMKQFCCESFLEILHKGGGEGSTRQIIIPSLQYVIHDDVISSPHVARITEQGT